MKKRTEGIEGIVVPFKGYGHDPVEAGQSSSTPVSWTAMNRAVSPFDGKVSEKDWDIYLGENQPKHQVEHKKGFMAAAKEKLVPRKAPPPFIPVEKKRHTAWLGRMATLIGRRGQQENPAEERNIGKPELRSTSNDFDDEKDREPPVPGTGEPQSRWSKTPEATSAAPWAGVLTPNKKSIITSPSAASSTASVKFKSPPRPAVSLPSSNRPPISPPRPLQPKHTRNTSVPHSDAESLDTNDAYGGVVAQFQTQLVPVPLHLGFETDQSRYPKPSAPRRYPPVPPIPHDNVHPPQRHRRSVSFPSAPKGGNLAGVGAGAANLTNPFNVHVRQLSASENPFMSPFDDERQVKIARPTVTRKSVHTNPFEGVAV